MKKNGGMFPLGWITMLSGKRGSGKTTMGLTWSLTYCCRGKKVLWINCDTLREKVEEVARRLTTEWNGNLHVMHDRKFSAGKWHLMASRHIGQVKGYDLIVIDSLSVLIGNSRITWRDFDRMQALFDSLRNVNTPILILNHLKATGGRTEAPLLFENAVDIMMTITRNKKTGETKIWNEKWGEAVLGDHWPVTVSRGNHELN